MSEGTATETRMMLRDVKLVELRFWPHLVKLVSGSGREVMGAWCIDDNGLYIDTVLIPHDELDRWEIELPES